MRRKTRVTPLGGALGVCLMLAACGFEGQIGGDPDDLPSQPRPGAPAPGTPDAPGHGAPYPLVLVHGLFGFDKIGQADYFFDVEKALEQDGHEVFIAKVDPINSSVVRGEQLLAFVDEVLQQTGSAKVNLIGHSQGGIDVRYAAHVRPDDVAAVVTVGTPHFGAHFADVVLEQVPGPVVEATKALFKMLGKALAGETIAAHSDIKAAVEQLSTAGMQAFNAKYVDQPGVRYYSIGGRSGFIPTAASCDAVDPPEFVAKYAVFDDMIDGLLLMQSLVVRGEKASVHDGMVQVRKTKWGKWLGCVPADHFDQVGQIFGDAPGMGNGFDHLEFYRGLASYLRAEGF